VLKNTLHVLNTNLETLFDTKEASQLLGKSMPWFERHRWAGTGPVFQKIGRTPYYKGEALLAFISPNDLEGVN